MTVDKKVFLKRSFLRPKDPLLGNCEKMHWKMKSKRALIKHTRMVHI